jgi:glycosyltransferase involved in cell wall biosynthesis
LKILFIHQNFPGQFRHIVKHLATQPEHQVMAIGQPYAKGIPEVPHITYKPARKITKGIHHYIAGLESAVLNGQAVTRVLDKLKRQHFIPDVVIGHAGWGETLYVKDVFPDTKLINYFEFYYHATGADTGFDPEYPNTPDDLLRIRTKNSINLLALTGCDIGISPTQWQKSLYPQEFHTKIQVIHEGIDVDSIKPDSKVCLTLPNGKTLAKQNKVITFVSRNLEPYRGFHRFMRAIPAIQRAYPDAEILIVGADEVSYGRPAPKGKTYRQLLLDEVKDIHHDKVHFLGQLPYPQFIQVLQLSTVHVYLTVPFVLSWSVMEAMAAGCRIVASDTAPVKEVIQHKRNGLLVDFFSESQLIEAITKLIEDNSLAQQLQKAAMETVSNQYTHEKGIADYQKLISALN